MISDVPNMSFAASCVSAFFYAFLRSKLLQKEQFLNFQKNVLFEAVINGEKLQKMARLEWSGMVWNDLECTGIYTPIFTLFAFTISICDLEGGEGASDHPT